MRRSAAFGILGNHDCAYDGSAVARALSAHGLHMLDLECRSVEFENAKITILGIPDEYRRQPEAVSLLKRMPAEPTIALVHDPAWFRYLPPGPYIMLAGHTHGGQIRFPGIGVIRNASKAPLRWSYGLIREKGQYLYVTSGIGTSGIPLRWRAPPEIVVLDLNGRGEATDATP